MPKADGLNPGDDAGADKTGGSDNGDAAGNAADDATNKGKAGAGKPGAGKDEGGDEPKLQFTQKELDDMFARRLARANRDAEDKAKLTKEQLLERERDDALSKVRNADARDSFIEASGIEYAKASKLFRMYRDDIEFDKSGKPENLKDVIATAKKEWPELFTVDKKRLGGGDGGAGGSGNGESATQGMNQLIRERAGRGNR